MIFGPSKHNLSDDRDFSNDPQKAFYDTESQLTNIEMMHEIIERKMEPSKMQEKIKRRMERGIRRKYFEKKKGEKASKRRQLEEMKRLNPKGYAAYQKKQQEKGEFEFKEPPLLGLLIRLFRGVKFEIKNIHIRYEDDLFSGSRPFAFGFTINHIKMDTQQDEEKRQRKQE
jgi:hypothetical protein